MQQVTNPKRGMFRTKQAAIYSGLSVPTLEKLRMTNAGPVFCKLGKAVVYDPDDIDDWLNARKRRSTSDVD